jgi:hypothetical protein
MKRALTPSLTPPSQISRLYRPISAEEDELLSDSESELDGNDGAGRGVPLLPTHQLTKSPANKTPGQIRLGDVWDEREELFEIGDDEDEENAGARHSDDTVRLNDDTPRASQAGGVKITVTAPS